MSNAELQEEEREVLSSIYDGDAAFKEITPTTYQYKYGDDNEPKSFVLEISWGPNYPTEKPSISMETFYNKHIIPEVKDKIMKHVDLECEQWLGCAMTYTLFQSVQEHLANLIEDQPLSVNSLTDQTEKLVISDGTQQMQEESSSKKGKKEQLTKAQKRRQWNKADGKGDKPRGWDWVDIVKHLSQSGSRPDAES